MVCYLGGGSRAELGQNIWQMGPSEVSRQPARAGSLLLRVCTDEKAAQGRVWGGQARCSTKPNIQRCKTLVVAGGNGGGGEKGYPHTLFSEAGARGAA